MNKDKQRIDELLKLIAYYDKQYYEEGKSDISDDEYDRLYEEYMNFEDKYPELKNREDSPTKRVGAGRHAGTTTNLPKFTHKSPLLSISAKSKDIEDLHKFYEKIGGDGTEVIIQPKLDGITCNINYENGKFVNAATRGNGYIGDLITDNFMNTDTKYPKTLSTEDDLEIRGEAIIPYDFFKENLIKDYSNPRNAVAGIMRQIDADTVKNKGVQVLFYDLGKTTATCFRDNDLINTRMLKDMGFQSIPCLRASCWESLKSIIESKLNGYIRPVDGFNVLLDEDRVYPQAVCDGIVIKVADYKLREKIGFTEKGPKFAFAYKFKPLQSVTKIIDVEWQVGKSGKITPVAIFEPITLGGTTITRATLNNYDYMQALPVCGEYRERCIEASYDTWFESIYVPFNLPLNKNSIDYLQPGDSFYNLKTGIEMEVLNKDETYVEFLLDGIQVRYAIHELKKNAQNYCIVNDDKGLMMYDEIIVERSNDVIPRIIAIKNRNAYLREKALEEQLSHFTPLTYCPTCGAPIESRGPLYYCINHSCPSQAKRLIEFYASRNAMNIVGFGEGIVDTLFESGFLSDIPSIYNLPFHREELLKLPKFGEKKVDKLLDSIEKSKECELWQFIYALSIDGVGQKIAKDLANEYENIDNFIQASYQSLCDMQDVGSVVASNIFDFLHNQEDVNLIKSLLAAGVSVKSVTKIGEKFRNKTFVITGTLNNPRKFYQDIIEKNGGKVVGSVSKKTNVVLIGVDAGSKEEKARKLVSDGASITILDTEEKIMNFLSR